MCKTCNPLTGVEVLFFYTHIQNAAASLIVLNSARQVLFRRKIGYYRNKRAHIVKVYARRGNMRCRLRPPRGYTGKCFMGGYFVHSENTQTWHMLDAGAVFLKLETTPEGLGPDAAQERLARYGENKLQAGARKSLLAIFLSQFKDFMIWILIAAAVVSAFLGEWVDCGIILFVVILNAVMGTIQESRAEAALEALKNMVAPMARVLRAGVPHSIPAAALVPGDVVLIEAGDSIPADIRLFACASLKAEESALTGESVPVDKDIKPVDDQNAALGDRTNMVYMGTSATYGRASGVVVSTGMDTQMGRIAGQLGEQQQETTPLSQKLNQISNVLSLGVLAVAALIFIIGLLSGRELFDMFLTAVSLAVAAIPEGLVAVITIVLAMGMGRMAQRGAIIRRLPAVETLGSTQIICSDKTGTLTQNRMTVEAIRTQDEVMLWQAMGHCNDSRLNETDTAIGDPTETALIDYLVKNGHWSVGALRARTRAGEIPFDSQRKRSSVAVSLQEGGVRIFVKGAPDVLISRCLLDDDMRARIERENDEMAEKALRVLAFAYKDTDTADMQNVEGTESGLTFIGLTGMIDPPRAEAREAIRTCRMAGILPVMITGDHKTTAVAIAQSLGILSDGRRALTGEQLEQIDDAALDAEIEQIGVYARVAPEHKTRIVEAWQRRGKVVAMTGDGVNDAPALKKADIGVGMGITGTDVSKGASDMVLTDDNFATIVTAVGEGRRIYDNIHKTAKFLLSSNAGEVIAVLAATLLGWRMLAPVHILWINLVTDTFPALALGVEPAENDIMQRPPRDKKMAFFTGVDWLRILLVGAAEAVLTLAAFIVGARGYASPELGMTMAFLTLSLSQLFATLGFQSERHSVFKMKQGKHRALWLALTGSAALQLIVVVIPGLRALFGLAALSLTQYAVVLLLCVGMLVFIELQKFVTRMLGRKGTA